MHIFRSRAAASGACAAGKAVARNACGSGTNMCHAAILQQVSMWPGWPEFPDHSTLSFAVDLLLLGPSVRCL
eukprot:1159195-Pelagomonas_calceolata.AAC.2